MATPSKGCNGCRILASLALYSDSKPEGLDILSEQEYKELQNKDQDDLKGITIHRSYKELCDCPCLLCLWLSHELGPIFNTCNDASDRDGVIEVHITKLFDYPEYLRFEFRCSDLKMRTPFLLCKTFWQLQNSEKPLPLCIPWERTTPESLGTQPRSWIKTCLSEHDHCRKPNRTRGSAWPTRLLDVFPGNKPRSVRLVRAEQRFSDLVSPQQSEAWSCDYITLSYCWGSQDRNPNALTTVDNLERNMSGIDLENLPRTTRHAVQLARLLGVRYLWVDSLCIIQPEPGNRGDWEDESPHMDEIYGGSLFTISAGVSDNCDGGLFEEEIPAPPFQSCFLSTDDHLQRYVDMVIDHFHFDNLDILPPSNRGWALQERLLSSRTLFCTPQGLFWECAQAQTSQWNQKPEPLLGTPRLVEVLKCWRETQLHVNSWHMVVENYTSRCLTVATDRLPAISGIINYIEKATGDICLAGVWKSNTLSGLMWCTSSAAESARLPGVPSWSWLSITARVEYGYSFDQKLNKCAQIVGFDMEKLPGQIHLRGFTGWLLIPNKTVIGKISKSEFTFDVESESEAYPEGSRVFCIILSQSTLKWHTHKFLLLEKVGDNNKNTFKRIGWLEFDAKGKYWYPEGCEERTIIIV